MTKKIQNGIRPQQFKMEDDPNNSKWKTTKKNSKWKTTKKIKTEDDQKNQNGR